VRAHRALRTYFASVKDFLSLLLFLEKRSKKSRLTEICLVSAAKNRAETKPRPHSGLRVLRGFLSHEGAGADFLLQKPDGKFPEVALPGCGNIFCGVRFRHEM
jgi:hypothetical protein